ncbi:MAG: hypothetical protein IH861_03910 [Chloroflexi bacterium]|nr:hypothetical protein [Chloroflexota bacterium]
MKITDVKSYVTMPRDGLPWHFVEVLTDEGVTGLGECSLYIGNQIITEAIQAVKPLVVGQDPANIEEVWQRIFRRYLRIGGRGIISAALSAIDIALWDIKGKVLGVPVYQLLGGPVRESVPLYTHVQDASYDGIRVEDAVELALKTKAEGYEAIKGKVLGVPVYQLLAARYERVCRSTPTCRTPRTTASGSRTPWSLR